MLARLGTITFALAVLLGTACEKTTHENIDKWKTTEKGPAKLAKAVTDESIDPDLSAHAAANMIRMGRDQDVNHELEAMPQARREKVVAALAPRLWDFARIEGEMELPKSSAQIQAKDSLIQIRKYADAATKQQIDGFLIDWYCVPSYDDAKGGGRAVLGAIRGDAAMRLIGPAAAKKMITVANGVIAAPGQEKVKNRVGDELLTALAATCSPDTVKYVLDVAKMDRGDKTLMDRAMNALYKAYVSSGGEFDACPKDPLVPSLDELVGIASNDAVSGQAGDDALGLISAVGPPQCMAPLVSMIAHPHSNPAFKFAAAQAALRCGGAPAIADVVHALPDGPYSQRELIGGVAGEIAKLTPRDPVLAQVRTLLDDKKVLARWVAVETLALMKSVEDAPRLAAIKSADKLVGFAPGKPDPTLGQRAKEVADELQKAPK